MLTGKVETLMKAKAKVHVLNALLLNTLRVTFVQLIVASEAEMTHHQL